MSRSRTQIKHNACTHGLDNSSDPKPTDWTEAELTAAAEAYERMVQAEQIGKPLTKKAVYQDLAERFPRTPKAFEFRMQNISAIRQDLGLPLVRGLRPADHIGANKRPQLELIVMSVNSATMEEATFKYGQFPSWQLPINAIVMLGGRATPAQILECILQTTPNYARGNLQAALYRLSVNSPSRVHYPSNKSPRRSDQGNEFDRLFQTSFSKDCAYELYEPTIHGIWEIYRPSDEEKTLAVRQVAEPAKAPEEPEDNSNSFDPGAVADTRRRMLGFQVRRDGQTLFRRAMLTAYDGTCAISDCRVAQVLQAAHIHDYQGHETNVASNGLLLRVDIHSLFDQGLIWIDPDTLQVVVSEKLAASEYWAFHGRPLNQPFSPSFAPSRLALEWHIANRVKKKAQ